MKFRVMSRLVILIFNLLAVICATFSLLKFKIKMCKKALEALLINNNYVIQSGEIVLLNDLLSPFYSFRPNSYVKSSITIKRTVPIWTKVSVAIQRCRVVTQ